MSEFAQGVLQQSRSFAAGAGTVALIGLGVRFLRERARRLADADGMPGQNTVPDAEAVLARTRYIIDTAAVREGAAVRVARAQLRREISSWLKPPPAGRPAV